MKEMRGFKGGEKDDLEVAMERKNNNLVSVQALPMARSPPVFLPDSEQSAVVFDASF